MSLHFIKTRGYLSRIHKFLFRLLGSVTANILICASLKICHKYVKFWQGKREKDIYIKHLKELQRGQWSIGADSLFQGQTNFWHRFA